MRLHAVELVWGGPLGAQVRVCFRDMKTSLQRRRRRSVLKISSHLTGAPGAAAGVKLLPHTLHPPPLFTSLLSTNRSERSPPPRLFKVHLLCQEWRAINEGKLFLGSRSSAVYTRRRACLSCHQGPVCVCVRHTRTRVTTKCCTSYQRTGCVCVFFGGGVRMCWGRRGATRL